MHTSHRESSTSERADPMGNGGPRASARLLRDPQIEAAGICAAWLSAAELILDAGRASQNDASRLFDCARDALQLHAAQETTGRPNRRHSPKLDIKQH